MDSENKNISLESKQSLNFLLKCFKEIDSFDTDFSRNLEKMEKEAKEKIIDSYYRELDLLKGSSKTEFFF